MSLSRDELAAIRDQVEHISPRGGLAHVLAADLLSEVDRLREGIRVSLNESRDMQSEMRSSVTLAYLQCELDDLLDPTEGETDADA